MAHFTLHRHPHVRTSTCAYAFRRVSHSARPTPYAYSPSTSTTSEQTSDTVTESSEKDGEQLFTHSGTEQYVTHIL